MMLQAVQQIWCQHCYIYIKKKKLSERDKAIDHMTSDPLTVGFLLDIKKKRRKKKTEHIFH